VGSGRKDTFGPHLRRAPTLPISRNQLREGLLYPLLYTVKPAGD
jgi:hypothetical protein